MRTKDESHDVFSIFSIQVQTEKESIILKVRTNHGGELENESFELFCEKHGVVDRKKKSLQERPEPWSMRTTYLSTCVHML